MGAAAIIGGVSSLAQAVQGGIQQSRASRAIRNYKRQRLINPYAGLQVSTLGADLQTEQLARRGASVTRLLQQMGGRGVFGGLSSLEASQQDAESKIAAQLDEQKIYNEKLRAQGADRVQQLKEQREIEDLRGLGAEYSAGQQSLWGGLQGIASIAATEISSKKG
tara:strand:+ start:177 stop:671 length:495 start_codon:yes stop_codon:yes gene_type:complete